MRTKVVSLSYFSTRQGPQQQLKRKFQTFSRLFQTSRSTFSKPTNSSQHPKSPTMFNRPPQFYFFNITSPYLSKKDNCIHILFCYGSLLPGRPTGPSSPEHTSRKSALDWVSIAKHPPALDVLGEEKRRARKRTDKAFSLRNATF